MAHRLRTLGLAALTLVTAGGLAGRRRRRRGRQAPSLAAARLSSARLRPAEHRLLSEAGSLLASSLDVEETAAHLASLCVASFGEWCVVYVAGTDDAGRTVVARHADAGRASIAERFEALARDSANPTVVEQVLQTHAPVVASPAAEEHLAAAAGSGEERALLDRVGVASFAAVPLMAGDACVGVIVAGSRRPRRRFANATIAMLIELGRRGAAAIVNARRYEDAQAAVRARDEMLAVVAHDLRSPLDVIEFATQRLRRDEPGRRRRSDDRSLDWIVGATRRAITLVRDLLESARLECGAFTLDDERRLVDGQGRPLLGKDGPIVVPFSPEAPLSGVGRQLQPDERLWYRRTFTVPDGEYDKALKALKTASEAHKIEYSKIEGAKGGAKVSVVGVGMRNHAGVAASMFKALADKGINIQLITTSEIKTSVLIDDEYAELAVRALHTYYGLDKEDA